MPRISVRYFATLREQRGLSSETVETNARTAADLYKEIQCQHGFPLDVSALRCAINDEFSSMDQALRDDDVVAFIAPVAGG